MELSHIGIYGVQINRGFDEHNLIYQILQKVL